MLQPVWNFILIGPGKYIFIEKCYLEGTSQSLRNKKPSPRFDDLLDRESSPSIIASTPVNHPPLLGRTCNRAGSSRHEFQTANLSRLNAKDRYITARPPLNQKNKLLNNIRWLKYGRRGAGMWTEMYGVRYRVVLVVTHLQVPKHEEGIFGY